MDFHEMPPGTALYNFWSSAADHPINWFLGLSRQIPTYREALPAQPVNETPL
jgi:hypothetical protein